MGPRELRDWEAYYADEPFGHMRDNMHAGLIAAAIDNMNRKRGSRARRMDDYLLVPQRDKFSANRSNFFTSLRSRARRKE